MKKRIKRPQTVRYLQYLQDYKKHIKILGYSINGIDGKCAHIGEFLAWLEKEEIAIIQAVKRRDIKNYHSYIKQRPHSVLGGLLSLKTISQNMYSIRLFFTFLQQRGDITIHPMSTLNFPPPKKTASKRIVLTIEEIKELYSVCEWAHERAVLSLAYGCGLRCGELAKVNLRDVKIADKLLIVPKGKGNKRRVIPMSNGVRADLKQYLEMERPIYLTDRADPAFLLNINGHRMMGYTCRKVIKRIVKRAANPDILAKNIATHHLRHSIATHLLAEGLSVEQVSHFLGHSHVETTEVYTRINLEQLKKLIQ